MHQEISPAQMRLIHVSHAPYGTRQRCDGGGCPAVYETSRGTYVIIGRRMSASDYEGLRMDGIEDGLVVPRELLRESAGKLS